MSRKSVNEKVLERDAGRARSKSVRVPRELSASPHVVFLALLKREGLPTPEAEFTFAPPRRWRFDYSWPEWKVALETEGGVWSRGRHTRGKGYIADMEKYSEAAILGWCVLRLTPTDLPLRGAGLVARALTTRGFRAPDAAAREIGRKLGA